MTPHENAEQPRKTIVIKLGTSLLTSGTPHLDKSRMAEIVRQCHKLRSAGIRVILVTSGAIAAGREKLGYPTLPTGIAYKQLLASVGQIRLIQLWEQIFSIYSIPIGQMLLTRADLEHRERVINARDMLHALLENDIVPVINENDAVATAEIKVGDNDNLSALAATLADADLLILLTDIDGLYSGNPHSDPQAKILKTVPAITESIRKMAGGSGSCLGTGGMATKIEAAEVACSAGIDVVVAAGTEENVLLRIMQGEELGTRFLAATTPLEQRKRWILGAPVAGRVFVDAGASRALSTGGASLLPIGITRVEGVFARGEVLQVLDVDGNLVGRGVTRYESDALGRIVGRQSQDIAAILGYEHGPVIIHRDDMIIRA